MADSNWRIAARLLREQNPDMTNAAIARLVGVGTPAVWKLLNPEKIAASRRLDNARRQEAKNRWQNAYNRSEKGRGRCACGNLRGSGAASRGDGRCEECIHVIADVRRTLSEGMWADGWSVFEMGAVMNVHPAYFSARRARDGWNLPHRRTPEQIERMREARWAA